MCSALNIYLYLVNNYPLLMSQVSKLFPNIPPYRYDEAVSNCKLLTAITIGAVKFSSAKSARHNVHNNNKAVGILIM